MKRMKYRASKVAFLGLLFALSVVLSLVESSLAPMVPVPGVKLGLSNIVTMYCLFCLGWREAYSLAALKSREARSVRIGPLILQEEKN